MLTTRVVYWFRRDLRLRDNRALARAYAEADEIIALYVLDRAELARRGLEPGHRWFTLLYNALKEMEKEIRVHVYEGSPPDVLEDLISRYKVQSVYTAKALMWSEREQVEKVHVVCKRAGVQLFEVPDNVLVNSDGVEPARSFTSFYKSWLKRVDSTVASSVGTRKFIEVDAPRTRDVLGKYTTAREHEDMLSPSWAYTRLKSFDFSKYGKYRDYPFIDGTSRLSPFINLGILSVRVVYNESVNRSSEFTRQLAWREYYYALAAKYPWMRFQELKPYMRGFEWENNDYYIECFVEGKTGYPIVDAGIRQLKLEGWVHNRIRLVMANFLVKDLMIDWRMGEKFFSKYLLDYDEVLNSGNWQWAASVGVDPIPLRIFNPITQAEKYDPLCYFIKKYIPELEGEDCRALKNPIAYRVSSYVEPIVNHYERARRFVEIVRGRLRRSWST